MTALATLDPLQKSGQCSDLTTPFHIRLEPRERGSCQLAMLLFV
jgi:hypothetical protein